MRNGEGFNGGLEVVVHQFRRLTMNNYFCAEQSSFSGLEVVGDVGAVAPTTSSAERENSRIVGMVGEWRGVGL